METEKVKTPMPTPQQRPDLYDDFDGIERPEGYDPGIQMPDYIQKMMDERKPKAPAGEK